MANQSPDRRAVLEMLAKVAAVSQIPGFCRWSFASEHEHSAPAKAAAYQPQFFSPSEYHLLDRLTDLIIPPDIPPDETPGAHDAGVVEFIDLMVAHDPALQFRFRRGLGLIDTLAVQTHSQDFMNLPAEEQEHLLRTIASPNQFELEAPAFFHLLRTYTVMGYYTTRIGLEALDDPGLRLYSASPECPHKDDPEHRHLPPPRY
jgi:gluconate 2-dehydrogenase subunit 3-like protein